MRLIFCALLCLAATGCARKPSPSVFVDPALATLVPAETVFLAGVRMQQLAATPFFRQYGGRLELVERFKEDTGLDAAKLWEFLIASDGRTSVTLIRGKFAEHGFEPRLERPGAERFSYKSYILIGDEQNAVVFLNPSTAAAGPAAALRRVVDSRNEATGIPRDLEARISQIPSDQYVWFASIGPPGNLPVTGDMRFAYGGLHLYSGIRAFLVLEFATAEAAARAPVLPMFDSGGARDGRVVRFSAETTLNALDHSTPWSTLLGVKSHERSRAH
jgi:hypothetical protein